MGSSRLGESRGRNYNRHLQFQEKIPVYVVFLVAGIQLSLPKDGAFSLAPREMQSIPSRPLQHQGSFSNFLAMRQRVIGFSR
jgi:hypothetical protein